MKWFRLWVDILDDHKLAQLSDYEFRVFIYLLACASEEDAINGTLTRQLPDINRRCRRRIDWLNKAVETFQSLGLVSISEDNKITINNWNKRQFKTDNSYDRVMKYREQQAVRNVSKPLHETLPDTDTDTDKKNIKKKGVVYSDDFLMFWNNYPKKVGKDAAWKSWEKRNGNRPEIEVIISAVSEQSKSDQWKKEKGQYIPNPSTWIYQGRWADEIEIKKPQGSW